MKDDQFIWVPDEDEPSIWYGLPLLAKKGAPEFGETVSHDAVPDDALPRRTSATALYRLHDAEGRLLYIGITNDLHDRWADHARQKPWWTLVARREAVWYKSRHEAHAAEVAAIQAEQPLHNGAHMAPTTPPKGGWYPGDPADA